MEQALQFDRKYFDPAALATARGAENKPLPTYLYSDEITLAVNLALATRRPLFVGGPPGTGKSSLADSVAALLDWRYLPQVVTSRTRARDLQWHFDAVRRLSDAQLQGVDLPLRSHYVVPRALWQAADPLSARQFPSGGQRSAGPAPIDERACVLLIDEIDKAEPDVPNDLLEVLETASFNVDDLDEPLTVRGDRERLLIVIASNGERDMPAAFLRRCVVLTLPDPDADWLVRVADLHYKDGIADGLHRSVAELTRATARSAGRALGGRRPGTAEYLDAVLACRQLNVQADAKNPAWQRLEAVLLRKAAGAAAAPAPAAGGDA